MSPFWTAIALLPFTAAFRFFGDSLYDCIIPFHFREANINLVTNDAFDPVTETAEYKACAVRIEAAA